MQNVILKVEKAQGISRSQANELEHWIHCETGIGSVDRCEKRQNVLMVDYDENRLSRNQILQHLSERGLSARVTSC